MKKLTPYEYASLWSEIELVVSRLDRNCRKYQNVVELYKSVEQLQVLDRKMRHNEQLSRR